MKKRYLVGLLVVIACFALVGCSKKTETGDITLDTIVKKFNTSSTVKKYKEYNYVIKAAKKNKKLVITTKTEDDKYSVSFNLDGTILSNDKITTDDLMATVILVDCIGQLHGYKDGELSENMNAFPDDFNEYTVENEGYELKENGDTYSMKIDFSKKIPLIDLSNLYLKPEDFDMIQELVEDNEPGNQTGKIAKLAYDVQISDEYNHIYIGERDELTDSAYKSILSALEVMYGTKIVDKFKSVYPSFVSKKTTVDGFTIETNYKMDEDESLFEDTKVVLVTIDNSIINK